MTVNTIRDTDVGTTFKVTMQKLNENDIISIFDISTYTTLEIQFLSPTNVVTTETCFFDTDGTDGVLTFTTPNTDVFLGKGGTWHYRGHVNKTGADFTNYNWLPFIVKLSAE